MSQPDADARPGGVSRADAGATPGFVSSSSVVVPPRTAATTIVKGVAVSAADHLAGSRADAVAAGAVRRESAVAAWLPIIYGCDKTCTYCIVPFSRGPERSRPFDEVVDEARTLAAAGYGEITLLGQNVNSYGHDLPAEARFAHVAEARRAGRQIDRASRPDLAELIRAIDALRSPDGGRAVPRLRFVTSHPWDLSDRLVDAMAEAPAVCAALHLPVQSGSDEVLHRMGRQYTIAHYQERLARIREAVPGIAVSTDVIVGFCGETEDQFAATLRLLETVRYEQVFAAAYSPRPGTPATRLPDDVPAAVKKERLNRLLAIQEEIGFGRNRERLGSIASVLIDAVETPRAHDHDHDGAGAPPADEPRNTPADQPGNLPGDQPGNMPADQPGDEPSDGPPPATLAGRDPFAGPLPDGWVRLAGRSRENRLVHLAGPASLVGRIVDVRLEAAGPYSLRGSLVRGSLA